MKEFDRIPDTPMEEWMDYLKSGKVKEGTRTPGLQRVREKLKVLNMTPADHEAYFRHLDSLMQQNDAYDTAISKGMAEGIQIVVKGRTEEKLEMARKIKGRGMYIDTIIDLTGLSEAEILEL